MALAARIVVAGIHVIGTLIACIMLALIMTSRDVACGVDLNTLPMD